jgi:hypothetical protein
MRCDRRSPGPCSSGGEQEDGEGRGGERARASRSASPYQEKEREKRLSQRKPVPREEMNDSEWDLSQKLELARKNSVVAGESSRGVRREKSQDVLMRGQSSIPNKQAEVKLDRRADPSIGPSFLRFSSLRPSTLDLGRDLSRPGSYATFARHLPPTISPTSSIRLHQSSSRPQQNPLYRETSILRDSSSGRRSVLRRILLPADHLYYLHYRTNAYLSSPAASATCRTGTLVSRTSQVADANA